MKDFDTIKSVDEYLKLFKEPKSGFKPNLIVEEAYKVALDTRKFEIDLYWKRATYFWAFIAASFAGYFVVFGKSKLLCIVIAVIGFFFSIGWYFVNRGSKYWQENWEKHLNVLTMFKAGPIFKIIKYPEANIFQLLEDYPFSVSKVNQTLSLIITFVWCYILGISSYLYLDLQWSNIVRKTVNISCLFTILLIGIVLLYNSTSFAKKGMSKKYEKNPLFLLKKDKK